MEKQRRTNRIMNTNFTLFEKDYRDKMDTLSAQLSQEQLNGQDKFILNSRIPEIEKEIFTLQEGCSHRLIGDDGICTICDKHISK